MMNRREALGTILKGIGGMVLAGSLLGKLSFASESKFEPITIDRKLLKELGIEEFVDSIDAKIRKNDLFGTKDPDTEFYKLLGTLDVKTAEELVKQRQYEEILKRYTNPVEAMIRYDLPKLEKEAKIKTADFFNVQAIGNRGKAITYYNTDLPNAERVKLLKNAEIGFIRSLNLDENDVVYVTLGMLYAASMGNYEKGIEQLNNALQINPNNSVAKVLKRKTLSNELKCHKTVYIFR